MQPPSEPLLSVALALRPYLLRTTPNIVSIHGAFGVGKSTVARYLSWKFNVSVLEIDLFRECEEAIAYRKHEIARIIDFRRRINRALIVEGFKSDELLASIGIEAVAQIAVTRALNAQLSSSALTKELSNRSTQCWSLELNASSLFETS